MIFLFLAYTFIWILLSVYLVSIHRRQNRLIEDLKSLRESMSI